jgi:hypothetical protein
LFWHWQRELAYDATLSDERGKIFTLERKKGRSKKVNFDDLQWRYLDGDGDFQSEEVKALRHEAEIFFAEWIQSHDSFENAPPFCTPCTPYKAV